MIVWIRGIERLRLERTERGERMNEGERMNYLRISIV